MDINEGTSVEDLWTPYKELVAVVEGYLAHEGDGAPYAVHTFESVLRRHKQTFLSLLKNPPKNSTSREELRRGVTEGVNLPSIGRTLLSKELVDEAIIISDMYNVNEYLAVELLHTAQRQAARHPGLPRGLVAVLLYYDGRRAAAQALRDLVTARDGVSWSVGAREEIGAYVSRYVGALVADGALGGALDALRRLTLAAELELLQANRALPPRRHYARLVANIETTRKLIAGVVFAASAQRGLDRDTLLRVLSEQSTSPTVGPTGALDEVSLALQMALLYALDLSVLHRREDGEELAKKLPLIQDPELMPALVDELCPAGAGAGAGAEQPPEAGGGAGARALCQLALGLALAALKRAPQSLLKRNGNGADIKMELLDQDEVLVDAAIDNKVFEYLDEAILSTEFVAREEYYQRRVHTLLTDFIVLMHSKLMEMRVKADEAARAAQMYEAEGLSAPGAGRTRLHALLRCVERLYRRDPHRLRDDYWRACDPAAPPPPAAHAPAAAHVARSGQGGRAATLYKFVRLSGELVCAGLLPLYLRALASLAVERHTWALLARRDALCAHHLLTALARYHCNLRADPGAFSSHSHSLSLGGAGLALGGAGAGAGGGGGAARGGRLAVRRSELEGMAGALRLLAAVARQDAAAAAALADNLQWDAVNCMFGLMCCHVPIQLKAELCGALAALGGWAATAPRVWAALDAAQLVAAAKDKRGLYAELQEVECRMEEYPLTRAFLSLLVSLCAAGPLPRALGAGARPPGLDPYLEHVLARVALPAPHRAYARPHEKWQVLALCFKLFAGWLEQYEPSASEFPAREGGGGGGGADGALPPPPGARLLLQLHTKSELLRLLLASLDDAHAELERLPTPTQQTEYVEESLVLILQILERGLAMERALVEAAAEAPRSMLIIGLSKLILEPEGPDNTDRLVTCCKVLQHGAALPAAAARAVALLARALRPPAAAAHLLAAITDRRALAADIRHGFVECLEAEEWGGGGGEAEAEAVRAAREGVVSLLQQLLPGAPPNLALLLLGYPAGGGALHEPGAAGHPRTCLHAVLDILDQHVAGHNVAQREASTLVEGCYRLVYWLCARPATSAATLRFLRARGHWLARHVRAHADLQVRTCGGIVPTTDLVYRLYKTASVVTLSARSWVLRACACEVGAAAAARHHPALGALLGALCGAGVGAGVGAGAGAGAAEGADGGDAAWEWCLLRRALDKLPVSVRPVDEPRWELFHAHHLRQAIATCDLPTGMGGKRISVSRVHALLARELAGLHASAPQTNLVTIEIQKVLDYVTEVNRQRNLAATLTHYYDSWRQLTEILFCVVPPDVLPLDARKSLLLNILQDLLNKIPPAEVLPQLGNLASGTVLLLLVNLRHCYILQKRDSNLKSSDFEASFFGPSSQIMQTKSLTLKFILHKILSWILVSGGSTQKMRVNLYGALLNFLNIVNLKSSPAEPEEAGSDATYVSRLDSSKARPSREESSLRSMAVDVISGFGDNLCEIVCGDCAGGAHDVCRMAALACLDSLVEVGARGAWLHALADRGHLRSLIDSLLQDDDGLLEALEARPRSLRVVYVYECKVALLLRLAATRAGAEAVLAQGTLAGLARLRALSAHPDIHTAAAARADTAFVPAVATRFRQMLVPALALCDALLTALGPQNHSCVIHVTHFLLSHVECVDMVLRAAHPSSGAGLLAEVEAVTSVVARASHRAVLAAVRAEPALRHAGAALRRLRALMLQLLPRFRLAPAAASPAAAAAAAAADQADNRLHYKIVCNLLTYARNILEVGSSRVVFGPALGPRGEGPEGPAGEGPGGEEGPEGEGPALGALLELLQGAVQAVQHHRKLLATAQHQLQSVPTMTLDDLRKLIPEAEAEAEAGAGAGAGWGPAAARGAGAGALAARLRVRREEAALCAHALDAALYLVWAHVHVYLRAAAPHHHHHHHHQHAHSMDISLSKADALRLAGGEELPALRKGLVAVFNERFTEQLLDTAKAQPATQRGFLEVMLKDIKNMIQFSPL